MQIKAYIQDFFKYLDSFEKQSTAFDTEAFLQTYNGICAVFQALRQQRDQAVEVDQFFLERIKRQPLTGSDLRQLAIQIMITYFESEADSDGQSNKSWLYCRELRPVKQDVPYFENQLVPMLFRAGALGGNFRLLSFFLAEIARYINKFGRRVHAAITPEEFSALNDGAKFLEMTRRRLELGADLLKDRNSLEFHLQRVAAFRKLAQKNEAFDYLLTDWKYLSKTSFWSKLKASLGRFFGKFRGAFSSWRYFRLVLTQRTAAYLYYIIMIIIFIFLAIYVPIKWKQYSQNKLTQFQQQAGQVQSGTIK